MGWLSDIFGGDDTEVYTTVQSTTEVTVAPKINIANLTDLSPIENLVTHMTDIRAEEIRTQADETKETLETLRELVTGGQAERKDAISALRAQGEELSTSYKESLTAAQRMQLLIGAAGLGLAFMAKG